MLKSVCECKTEGMVFKVDIVTMSSHDILIQAQELLERELNLLGIKFNEVHDKVKEYNESHPWTQTMKHLHGLNVPPNIIKQIFGWSGEWGESCNFSGASDSDAFVCKQPGSWGGRMECFKGVCHQNTNIIIRKPTTLKSNQCTEVPCNRCSDSSTGCAVKPEDCRSKIDIRHPEDAPSAVPQLCNIDTTVPSYIRPPEYKGARYWCETSKVLQGACYQVPVGCSLNYGNLLIDYNLNGAQGVTKVKKFKETCEKSLNENDCEKHELMYDSTSGERGIAQCLWQNEEGLLTKKNWLSEEQILKGKKCPAFSFDPGCTLANSGTKGDIVECAGPPYTSAKCSYPNPTPPPPCKDTCEDQTYGVCCNPKESCMSSDNPSGVNNYFCAVPNI
jgi:hypothetical protein